MVAASIRKYPVVIFLLIVCFSYKSTGQVVLNEVQIKPRGNINMPTAGFNGMIYTGSEEYIELYNRGCVDVDVAGYFIAMKQTFGSAVIGGTLRIPAGPKTLMKPGDHLVLGSAAPPAGGILVGNVDITFSTAAGDYCTYPSGAGQSNLALPNTDGWVAFYDKTGDPLECIYWSDSAKNISSGSNSTDFDPGTICVPSAAPATPAVTLLNAKQIFDNKKCVVTYIPNKAPVMIYRQKDGDFTWVSYNNFSAGTLPSTVNKAAATGNCNGGSCVTPVQPPPGIFKVNDITTCGGTGSVVLNNLPNNLPNNNPDCSVWTVTVSPSGDTKTGTSNTSTVSNLAAGKYTFTVANSGQCVSVVTAEVEVKNLAPSCCNVGAASTQPTVCVNTAISNITHTTSGATGIGTATGLPGGVTAGWANNTITISGTPTATGTFTYSIPVTGCSATATGKITVTASQTASAPSSQQTLCANTALTAITHTTTGATGIDNPNITGLPAGVTANWNNNTITISGTPTSPGIYTYSIPLTGGCGTAAATGTITVSTSQTASAASAAPSVCVNSNLPSVTHTTTGATGIDQANITGLPAGVTASWANNTITISGKPTAKGSYSYTIPLTGGCGAANATGTITVTEGIGAKFAQEGPYCLNDVIALPILPTTSLDGITGKWTPASLSTAVAGNIVYTFKPDAGQCAKDTTMTVVINQVPAVPALGVTDCSQGAGKGVVTVTSPTTPPGAYEYSIDKGVTFQASPIFTDVADNKYTIIVRDVVTFCNSESTEFDVNCTCPGPPVTPQFDPIATFCINTPPPALLTTSKDGITGTWEPPAISNLTDGVYTFTPDAGQCANQTTLTVTVALNPAISAGGPELNILEGESITLEGNALGNGVTYKWTPTTDMTDETTLNPVVNPLEDITYELSAETSDGCKATDTVRILVLKEITVPNAFSPNGDGINDRFVIDGLEKYKTASVEIFNRFGQIVYRTSGLYTPWNGTYKGQAVPVGTYFYVIRPGAGKSKVLSGSVTILK